MAGHNKWSKIKRQKAATDAKKSKAWARIARDLMVAARDGGGDPSMNARLALAVDKAKAENMPKDNVERAIGRGTGAVQGADYEEQTYECYGPHGVAVFVDVLTDNTNRTVADLRHLFSKSGGNLGTTGAVAFLFEQKGVFEILAAPGSGPAVRESDLFLLVAEAGAEDLHREDDRFVVIAPVEAFGAVQAALDAAGVPVEDARLERIPTVPKRLSADEARPVVHLLDALDDHPDVQAVTSTLDLDGLPRSGGDETADALSA